MRRHLLAALVMSLITALAQIAPVRADSHVPTTVTVSSTRSPSTFGESVRWAATVNTGSAPATGWVTFQEGTTVLARQRVNPFGIAFYWTSLMPVGDHTIMVIYEGDARFAPSTAVLHQRVDPGSPTIDVMPSKTAIVAGETMTVTAKVGPRPFDGFVASAPIPYAANNGPTRLVAMDFGDGRDDLIGAVPGQGVVSFSTVGLTSLFGVQRLWPGAAAGTVDIAVADFTGDGVQDVAAANMVQSTIRILPGENGGFGSALSYFPGLFPNALTAGDFDSDGLADLAVTLLTENKLVVLRNVGGGDFAETFSLNLVGPPRQIITGDFNEDHKLDLAVLCEEAFGILLNDGAGRFGNSTGWVFPNRHDYTAIAAADLTRDGHLDLAITIGDPYQIVLVKGTGNGLISQYRTFSSIDKPVAITVADFDRDGWLDVATANGRNEVDLIFGDEDLGSKNRSNYPVGVAPAAIVASDFNGDGKIDLVVSNRVSGDLTVLLNGWSAGASGSVQFAIDGVNVGGPVPLDSDGEAAAAIPGGMTLAAGAHTITAQYGGDDNFAPASGTSTITAERQTPLVQILVKPRPSGTYIEGTVSPTMPSGGFTATGTIQFSVNGAPLGDPVPLDASGLASATTPLAPGTYTFAVQYSGDVNYQPGSRSISGAVAPVQPTGVLSPATATATPGNAMEFRMTISDILGYGIPSGTVQFKDNGAPIGGPRALDANGVATLVSLFAGGAHVITAEYSGSADYLPVAATANLTVNRAATTGVLEPATATTTAGTALEYRMTVRHILPYGIPSGTVQFKDNGAPIGGPRALDATGIARLASTFAVGAHVITAEYPGSADSLPAAATANLAVNPMATTLSLSSSANPIPRGGSVTFMANLNRTGMNFARSSVPLADSFLSGAATADFNEDGRDDIVSLVSPNVVSLVLSNGDGTFAAPKNSAAAPQSTAILAVDLNGDGHRDVVTSSWQTEKVTVLLGDGHGNLGAASSMAVPGVPEALAAGDFNGDGITDIAVGARMRFSVAVLLGNGDGSFQAPAYSAAGGFTDSIVAADFDGDGKLDIASVAIPASLSGAIAIMRGNGDGTFALSQTLALSKIPRRLALADVDGDGVLDLAAAGYNLIATTGDNVFVSLMKGLGAGRFADPVHFGVGSQPFPYGIVAADFNADGRVDMLVSTDSARPMVIFGNGAGQFSAPHAIDTQQAASRLAAAGDFDADGRPDLVVLDNAMRGGLFMNRPGLAPAGTVRFMVDGQPVGSPVAVAGAFATVTTTLDSTGTHQIAAHYSGDPSHVPSDSNTLDEVVNDGATTTTTVRASVNAPTVGESVTLTAAVATVGPAEESPTGSVQFKDNGIALGAAVMLQGGAASITTSSLAVGSHSITAEYAGNTEFPASVSEPLSLDVKKAAVTMTLETSSSLRLFEPITLTATINVASPGPGASAAFKVLFKEGSSTLAGGPVSVVMLSATSARAVVTVQLLNAGPRTFTATLAADDRYSDAQASADVTVKVLPTFQISFSSQSPVYGDATVMTVRVRPTPPATATPTGTIVFSENGSPIGAAVQLVDGAATLALSNLTAGSHLITIEYSGDALFFSRSSVTGMPAIKRVTPTIEVSASKAPLVFGEPVTFTVKVAYSAGTPTGTVQFNLNGMGSEPFGAPVPLINGVGTLTTAAVPVNRPLGAVYSGDTNFVGYAICCHSPQVGPATAILTVEQSAAETTFGQPVTFTATVRLSAPSTAPATGAVVFAAHDGNVLAPISPEIPLIDGVATFTTSTLSAGERVLVASAANRSVEFASTAVTFQHVVRRATPVLSGLSSQAIGYGTAGVTLSGAIKAGSLIPGGVVSISVNGVAQNAPIAADGSFTATLDTHALGAASAPYVVTYKFDGSRDFAAVADSTTTLTVNRRKASVTPNAATKKYGDADPSFSGLLEGFLAGDGVTASYSRGAGEDVNGGPYAIGATLGPASVIANYDVTYNTAPFTITRAAATVAVDGYSGVYDGSAHGAKGSATGVHGEDLSSLLSLGGAFVNAPGGTASWTFAGNGNYQPANGSAAIAIARAPLTIMAEDKAMIAGGAMPPLTAAYAGFVNGESAATLDSPALLATPASPGSPAGVYPIAVSGASDANYQIAFVNGTLTIDYGVCLLYDPAKLHKIGSTVPITIQLCDARGGNLSSPALTLNAVGLMRVGAAAAGEPEDAGNANPDGDFRTVGPVTSYMFNLQTKGFAPGSYALQFVVNGGGRIYSVPLQVR